MRLAQTQCTRSGRQETPRSSFASRPTSHTNDIYQPISFRSNIEQSLAATAIRDCALDSSQFDQCSSRLPFVPNQFTAPESGRRSFRPAIQRLSCAMLSARDTAPSLSPGGSPNPIATWSGIDLGITSIRRRLTPGAGVRFAACMTLLKLVGRGGISFERGEGARVGHRLSLVPAESGGLCWFKDRVTGWCMHGIQDDYFPSSGRSCWID